MSRIHAWLLVLVNHVIAEKQANIPKSHVFFMKIEQIYHIAFVQ